MKCPNCESENVQIQVVQNITTKTKHHSILYWLFIGWWLQPFLWLFFTFFKLIALFIGKKKEIITKEQTKAVCQDCGYTWNVNTQTTEDKTTNKIKIFLYVFIFIIIAVVAYTLKEM